jgi:hypothetical protein
MYFALTFEAGRDVDAKILRDRRRRKAAPSTAAPPPREG